MAGMLDYYYMCPKVIVSAIKVRAIVIKKGDTIFFEIKGKSDKGITEL